VIDQYQSAVGNRKTIPHPRTCSRITPHTRALYPAKKPRSAILRALETQPSSAMHSDTAVICVLRTDSDRCVSCVW
jgi:hypothetical protein